MTQTQRPRATAGPSSGRRSRRRWRRARGLPGTLGVTALATVLPGSGFLYAGRRVLGLAVLVPTLVLGAFGIGYLGRGLHAALDVVFDPGTLTRVAVVAVAVLLGWILTIALSYVMVRPRDRPRWHSAVGVGFVLAMCLLVAAPLALAARYSLVQADLVKSVFEGNRSATAPIGVTKSDPWAGRERVTVLLLGGDGNVHREGVRTDSMILASIDVHTGRTVLFSLPRNLMHAPFPEDTPLRTIYPHGYGGDGDPGNWLLNAVYRVVPALHPGVLGASDNEGADALKLAVQGVLDLPVDYYVLVNLAGFRTIVDAMGGVTVDINEPVPIGGNTDLGIPPDDYLQPGPHQRLDGFEALWFSRGRYGSDDYHRMERQRCMIDAIIDEADPLTLLRRYQALAAAGKKLVRTDIPRRLLPPLVDLGTRMKGADVRSVVFRSSARFRPADPDFAWMRRTVRTALQPPTDRESRHGGTVEASGGGTPSSAPVPDTADGAVETPGEAVDPSDTCGYQGG